jgi:hypothetical protein
MLLSPWWQKWSSAVFRWCPGVRPRIPPQPRLCLLPSSKKPTYVFVLFAKLPCYYVNVPIRSLPQNRPAVAATTVAAVGHACVDRTLQMPVRNPCSIVLVFFIPSPQLPDAVPKPPVAANFTGKQVCVRARATHTHAQTLALAPSSHHPHPSTRRPVVPAKTRSARLLLCTTMQGRSGQRQALARACPPPLPPSPFPSSLLPCAHPCLRLPQAAD